MVEGAVLGLLRFDGQGAKRKVSVTNQPKTSKRRHRKFDLAFKRHGLELWRASGKSAPVIAQGPGIEPKRLYAWRQSLELKPTPAQLAALVAVSVSVQNPRMSKMASIREHERVLFIEFLFF